ncbi:Uncharacterised protein [Vibrio cholerae]|nr:Uncharacterised protein [Vibrio cholerae]CSC39799.1 Uncharacterised protein [Vibrio cholerae]
MVCKISASKNEARMTMRPLISLLSIGFFL